MYRKFKNKYISSIMKRWFFTINHKRIGIMCIIFGVFNGFLSILLLGLTMGELSSPGTVTIVLILILILVLLFSLILFFFIYVFFLNSYVYIKDLVFNYIVIKDLKLCNRLVYQKVSDSKYTYRAVKWISELELEIINFYPNDADLLYSDLRNTLLYIGKNKVLDNYDGAIFSMIEYEDFMLDVYGFILPKSKDYNSIQYFNFNSADFTNDYYSVDCYISILLSCEISNSMSIFYKGKVTSDRVEKEEIFLFFKELGSLIKDMDFEVNRLDVYGFTKLNSGKSFLYEFVIRELYHNLIVSRINNGIYQNTNSFFSTDIFIFFASKNCDSYLSSREFQSRASFAKLKLENPVLNYISYEDLIENLPLFVYSVIIAANSKDWIEWSSSMEYAKFNIKESIKVRSGL